jgi:cyclohexa-1,5-dienecarbonyl-CoA hydratase
VLVIDAVGKAWSAGVDVADHTPDKIDEMMRVFGETFTALDRVPFVTIAAVHAAALGGGCEIALACDVQLLSDRAKIGQPEIQLGVFAPIAAALAPRLAGWGRAMAFLAMGETIVAADAERIGLATRVLPSEGFAESVDAFAASIARHSRVAVEMNKRAMRAARGPVLEGIRAAEKIYLNQLLPSADASEGIAAYLEKRAAVWKHR